VGDAVDLSKLAAADIPSAWLVYNLDRLPAAEKSRLQALAPVIDPRVNPTAVLAACPVRAKGLGLNCLAFVDQNGSVIVMVSNLSSTATVGSLEFTNVVNGTFACNGLLGTPNGTLTVKNNAGSLPIVVDERDTIVLEIPGLQWIGHLRATTSASAQAMVASASIVVAGNNYKKELTIQAEDADYIYTLDRAATTGELVVADANDHHVVARVMPDDAAAAGKLAAGADCVINVVPGSDGGKVITVSDRKGARTVVTYRWNPAVQSPALTYE